MANFVSKQSFSADDTTFTLANGANDGRAVAIVAAQSRTPPDMSTVTFHDVPPTRVETLDSPLTVSGRVLVAYWDNADLPDTAGDYALLINGDIQTAYEIETWDGSAPEFLLDVRLTADGGSPHTVSFTNQNIAACVGFIQDSASSVSGLDGSTFDNASGFRCNLSVVTDSGEISWSSSNSVAYAAIAFKSAASSTPSLTTTLVADASDTALPASTTVNVRVFNSTNALVGIGTITVGTSGAVSITDADLTLEAGMSLENTLAYRVDFQEAGGTRQRTVELTAAV